MNYTFTYSKKDGMGEKYPVNTYDEEGSDPKNPGNSRFTLIGGTITSGPARDPDHNGEKFLSVDNDAGPKQTYIIPDTTSNSNSSNEDKK